MKKFVIIIRHANFEEMWATTGDFKTALKYAVQAILENKGKTVQIR